MLTLKRLRIGSTHIITLSQFKFSSSEGSKSLSISALSATKLTNSCCPVVVFANLDVVRKGTTVVNSVPVESYKRKFYII